MCRSGLQRVQPALWVDALLIFLAIELAATPIG
jgi:hypothetical protein